MRLARIVAATLTGLMAAPAASAAAASDETVIFTYNGYFGPFRLVKATLEANVEDGAFTLNSGYRAAGLAGCFSDADIRAEVTGAANGERLAPTVYEHRNLASKKGRVVRIEYGPGSVTPVIDPPFGSMGEPPATAEERAVARDPITTFFAIAMEGGANQCDATLPVFDGKQRYDLRFEKVGEERVYTPAHAGQAIKCHVYYTPVSGFDQEDLADPETYATPMTLWLGEVEPGVYAPMRIRAKVSGVSVSIVLRKADVRREGTA